MTIQRKPRLAVWKFASCDGCQLTLLDCEEELLDVVGAIDIGYFVEATRAVMEGPYDLSLVEGSITTAADARRIREIRAASTTLVAIGACATAGGIQALRNFADHEEFLNVVYPETAWIDTLAKSTPITDHVFVDFELRGCPIQKEQLIEVISALLNNRRPNIPTYSVCMECKRLGTTCVMVANGLPCLGPVTQAGCNALCPRYGRGCFGCFGPMESANPPALSSRLENDPTRYGMTTPRGLRDLWRTYNAYAEPFRKESERHESGHKNPEYQEHSG